MLARGRSAVVGLSLSGRALVLIGVSEHDARIEACRSAGLPLAAIGYPADPTVPCVVPDDADGARQAVTHLAQQGRKRLALLFSVVASGGDPALSVRRDAALATASAHGVSMSTVETESDVSNTLAAYRTVFRSGEHFKDVNGLFCDTDKHALGAIAALKDLGLNVPRDVSVVGFDDIPGFSASLTTVRQDFRGIARAAVALFHTAEDRPNGAGIEPQVVSVKLILPQT